MSETIVIYRCAECGATDTSLGGIHGHIESHRSGWRVYKTGDPEFLYELTERYEVPIEDAGEYRTDARDNEHVRVVESVLDRFGVE